MQINVLRELRQTIGAVSVVDFEEEIARFDDLVLHELTGSVSMLRTDRGLLVTVTVEGQLREGCSRCLKEIETPVEATFEEEYVPVLDANTGAPVRNALLPDTFRIGPDFILDLHEGVRQYILMSEPAKPLCRPDCKGLCPNCGADLNQGACRCSVDGDDRWQALAGLKTEIEGS